MVATVPSSSLSLRPGLLPQITTSPEIHATLFFCGILKPAVGHSQFFVTLFMQIVKIQVHIITYLDAILVHSCCYNKISQTGWLRNHRNLFIMVLEVGNPRSRHWQIPHLVRSGFLVHGQSSSHCVLTRWKDGGRSLGVSFIRALIAFMRALSL